jgi:hypothetical protein
MREDSWSPVVFKGEAAGVPTAAALASTKTDCAELLQASEAVLLCDRAVASIRGVIPIDQGVPVPKGWPIYEVWVTGAECTRRAESEFVWRQFAFPPDDSGRFYNPSLKSAFVAAIQSVCGEGSQARLWLRGYANGEQPLDAHFAA